MHWFEVLVPPRDIRKHTGKFVTKQGKVLGRELKTKKKEWQKKIIIKQDGGLRSDSERQRFQEVNQGSGPARSSGFVWRGINFFLHLV